MGFTSKKALRRWLLLAGVLIAAVGLTGWDRICFVDQDDSRRLICTHMAWPLKSRHPYPNLVAVLLDSDREQLVVRRVYLFGLIDIGPVSVTRTSSP